MAALIAFGSVLVAAAAAPSAPAGESLFSERPYLPYLLLGAIVLLMVMLMRRGSRGRAQLTVPPRTGARDPREPAGVPLRGEAESLLVELQEFGREIEGRLETRIHHLTRLIAEADRAIERLTGAVASASTAGPPVASPAPAVEPAAGRDPDSPRSQIVALRGEGLDPDEIARRLGIPRGEVELVLGLEGKLAEGPRA